VVVDLDGDGDGDGVVDVGVSRLGSQHLPILECLAPSASDLRPAPRRSTIPRPGPRHLDGQRCPDQVHAAVAVKVHDHDQVNDHVNVRMSRRGFPEFSGQALN
jgi:hypothetical protein